jgi:hypothetical protein
MIHAGAGVVYPAAGEYDFLYSGPSTALPSGFAVGDGLETPDGRRFRLAKAGGTIKAWFGAQNPLETIANAVAPAQATGAGTVGSRFVTLTKGATAGVLGGGVIAKDELAGSMIVVGNGTNEEPQNRLIVANPASASGSASLTVQLDAPLGVAVSVGVHNIETMPNRFSYINNAGDAYSTFVGVPTRHATIGQYVWVQTKGLIWITSDDNTAAAANDRAVYFANNGSLLSRAQITEGSHPVYQLAGYVMDASSTGNNNAPFVELCLES